MKEIERGRKKGERGEQFVICDANGKIQKKGGKGGDELVI